MDFPGGQWLRLHTSNVVGVDLIPGQGTKILHVSQSSQNLIKKNKTQWFWTMNHGRNIQDVHIYHT